MSLVEVIVAMMLLVGVVLVLGGFSAQFARATAQAHLIVTANELAATRLDAVRQQPSYSAIDSLVRVDTVKADYASYSQRTQMLRIGEVRAADAPAHVETGGDRLRFIRLSPAGSRLL